MTAAVTDHTAAIDVSPDRASAPVAPLLLTAARVACAVMAVVGAVAVVAMIVGAWRRGATDVAPPGAAAALAVFVVAAIASGFLAAHGRARVRPRAFAGVTLAVCAAQGAMLVALLGPVYFGTPATGAVILPVPFLWTALGLTAVAAALAGLIVNRAATEDFLLQTAHRAFAVGFWVFVGRVILALWGRPLGVTGVLLPVAFGLFAWAALVPLALVRLRPERRRVYDEGSSLALAAAVMLIPTIAWLVASRW